MLVRILRPSLFSGARWSSSNPTQDAQAATKVAAASSLPTISGTPEERLKLVHQLLELTETLETTTRNLHDVLIEASKSIFLATECGNIRSPPLSVPELVTHAKGTHIGVGLLGGMAPNHSPLTQPFPMVKWLSETKLFDDVFYGVNPPVAMFGRSAGPEKGEPNIHEVFALEDRCLDKVLPTHAEVLESQRQLYVDLVRSFPENTLDSFCVFGYSMGAKYMLRIWPDVKRELLARHPKCKPFFLTLASGFDVTAPGADYIGMSIDIPQMRYKDKRFPMLAKIHGPGLPEMCNGLRRFLFGKRSSPGKDCLYGSVFEGEREPIQVDDDTHVIFSPADPFFTTETWWYPEDPNKPPQELCYDLSQVSDTTPLEEVDRILDAQNAHARLVDTKLKGTRLSYANGAHIPMGSGSYQHLTQRLVTRILRDRFGSN